MARTVSYEDPFYWHRIVNVGWGGLGILTIEYLTTGDPVSEIRATVPDREFTSTEFFNEAFPPDPGPAEYPLIVYPAEDNGPIPNSAWQKTPALFLGGLRTNDLPPVLVDPGGVEVWTDLFFTWQQYESHADKFNGGEHEADARYQVGGLDIVDGEILGAPGDPGLYIGDGAFSALYPGDPVPDPNPPVWAHDTLVLLQAANPEATYRLSVTNPSGNTLRLQYQVHSFTTPVFQNWRRDVFVVNFSKLQRGIVSVIPATLAANSLKLETYPRGQVMLYSPVSPDPEVEFFHQFVKVGDSPPSNTYTRTVSGNGELARFSQTGFADV